MQNKNNYHDRLKVSLHGMDDKAYKMMVSYLALCCEDIVAIVVESESQAEIIDVDLAQSRAILEKRLAQQPPKPIIVLSVQKVSSNDIVYVKKPVEKSHIVEAIKGVREKIQRQIKQNKNRESLKAKKEETVIITKNIETTPINISEPDGIKQNSHPPEYSELKEGKLLQQKPGEAEVLNKNIEPEMTTSKSSYEINNLLDSFLDGDNFDFFEISPIEAIQNGRRTVRYGIHSIKAKLQRNSFFASKKILIVWVLNVSSKGALIEMKTPVKLKGKVTLTIYFDPQHVFSVPAQVVRAEKESLYGLQFSSYQHELADYLVDNGHLFSIV